MSRAIPEKYLFVNLLKLYGYLHPTLGEKIHLKVKT